MTRPKDLFRWGTWDVKAHRPIQPFRSLPALASAVRLTAIRQWRIIEAAELIETSIFTKQITALLSDDDYGAFQSRLAANPSLGVVIKGRQWNSQDSCGSWLQGQARGRPRHLLLGSTEGPDSVALCLPEERVGRSGPEATGATRQGSQGGVEG